MDYIPDVKGQRSPITLWWVATMFSSRTLFIKLVWITQEQFREFHSFVVLSYNVAFSYNRLQNVHVASNKLKAFWSCWIVYLWSKLGRPAPISKQLYSSTTTAPKNWWSQEKHKTTLKP